MIAVLLKHCSYSDIGRVDHDTRWCVWHGVHKECGLSQGILDRGEGNLRIWRPWYWRRRFLGAAEQVGKGLDGLSAVWNEAPVKVDEP